MAFTAAVEEFHLHVVERVEVGEAVAHRTLEKRVGVEQRSLAGDGEQHALGVGVLGFDARENRFAQLGVLHQVGVAAGDGNVTLGQHHVHV